MQIPVEVKRAGEDAVAAYKRALPYGEKWAAMVATQTPPGTSGTDRAFMEGRMNNQQLDEMPVRQAKYVAAEAKSAGINISGKHYVGGLADKRGWRDPEAWVSNNDDVLKVAHRRRLAVAGTVNYDPGAADPKRKLISEFADQSLGDPAAMSLLLQHLAMAHLAQGNLPEAKAAAVRALWQVYLKSYCY
jgi:hypothetical protein